MRSFRGKLLLAVVLLQAAIGADVLASLVAPGKVSIGSGQIPTLNIALGGPIEGVTTQTKELHGMGGGNFGQQTFLPVSERIAVSYKDQHFNMFLDCSSPTMIVADSGLIDHVNLHLCDPPVNDWAEAIDRLEGLIASFQELNPRAERLSVVRNSVSAAQLNTWRAPLLDKLTRTPFPLNSEQANAFFQDDLATGNVRQKLEQNTYALLESFRSGDVTANFGISKRYVYGPGGAPPAVRESTFSYVLFVDFQTSKPTDVRK